MNQSANQSNSKGIESERVNQPEPSLRDSIRKCFTDTEMEHDDDLTLFDVEQTITNLVELFQAHEEAAVRSSLVDEYKKIYTMLNNDSNEDAVGDLETYLQLELSQLTHPQAGEGEGK